MYLREIIYNDEGIKSWLFTRKNSKNIQLETVIEGSNHRETLRTPDLVKARIAAYKIIESYKDNGFSNKDFKMVAAQFLKTMAKKTTKKSYESTLNSVFYPFFGDKKITEITEQMIYAHQMKRVEKILPQSVNKEMVVLKQILKFSKKMGYIKKNARSGKIKRN